MLAKTVRVQVPFCGFYESSAADVIECHLESEEEYLATGGSYPFNQEFALKRISDLISEETFSALYPIALDDWEAYEDTLRDLFREFVSKESEREAKREIARTWIRNFCSVFDAHFGIDLCFDLSTLLIVSPPYYNFDTDRLFCRASFDALKELFEENRGAVASYARRVLSPRDGFAPFLSSDVEDWGPCEEWGAEQWGLILEALECQGAIDEELCGGIYESKFEISVDYEGLFRAVVEFLTDHEKAA